MSDLIKIADRLLANVKQDDFAGYDPFDSLNSRLLKATPLYGNSWVRLAWLQLGKRSPINLRPLLGVPKMRNPKGVGLFILGMLEDYRRTGDGQLLSDARRLGDWLLDQRCDTAQWQYACWGYHFDWQARAFYVPVGRPNIITTVYVARALHALGIVTGDERYGAAACDAARFIRHRLLTEHEGRTFFAYIPDELAFVHNASLWGAAWVGFVGAQLGDDDLSQVALAVARQSLREQRADGAWVYGARHHHQFIDGFHTGYNLEALQMLADAQETGEFDEGIKRGLEYYREAFFLPDGTAKYYENKVYPLDLHSFSQAVFTLLKVGKTTEDLAFTRQVLSRAIDEMYLPSLGRFAYQKQRRFTNRVDYVRWTQAWAYYGLAFFNRHCAELKDHHATD